MLKTLALVLLAALLLVLAYAATRPDSFSIARSTRIQAPPERVWGLIQDLKGFNRWNPWERKDPGKGKYGATSAGPGASYSWASDKLGAGAMTVTAATPGRQVTLRLDFLEPMKATNIAEFTLLPEGDGTQVTWAMSGRNNYLSKLMQVFFSMDRMVGDDFAAGLANLKALAEAP